MATILPATEAWSKADDMEVGFGLKSASPAFRAQFFQRASAVEQWARTMTKDKEDTIYSAYLGVCVLQTMCRKAGLNMAVERSRDLISELQTAFPFIIERDRKGILRTQE